VTIAFVRRHGDLLLAAGIVVLAQIQIWTADDLSDYPQLGLAAASLALGAMVALPKANNDEWIGLFVLLGVYTAAAHTGGRKTAVAAVLTLATGLVVLLGDSDQVDLGGILFFGFLFATPWVTGRAIRRRRLRARQLEREKSNAEAAIAEERTRIARELHDVVAHAISVIVLQARGGRKLLDDEPEETRRALDAIERTASQALAEMRRLLGLLRDSDDQLELTPQPTLARLDDLAKHIREAGLPVEIDVRGSAVELPPGIDLSAYRIVQEALTNALKHAGPASARVTLDYEPGELLIEITDDGAGTGNGGGTGHGLVGIRERASVFGGDVEAGPRTDGGYAVRARLPYSSER
jgi:signal transduction histidine kinase